jgi:hypothetical protein
MQWPNEKGQTIQWPNEKGQKYKQYKKEKDKRTNNDIQNTTQKTKDQATRIQT